MHNLLRKCVMLGIGTLLLASGWAASPGQAQVSVNINIGAPPPVVVHAPPTMLFLPEPGFYVAVGLPYDIYFVSGRYFYLHGDHWFWASGYNGPWVYVAPASLPPGLQKFKVAKLRTFRDREYNLYRSLGPEFRGKRFKAVASADGNNNGNGRGKGNR